MELRVYSIAFVVIFVSFSIWDGLWKAGIQDCERQALAAATRTNLPLKDIIQTCYRRAP